VMQSLVSKVVSWLHNHDQVARGYRCCDEGSRAQIFQGFLMCLLETCEQQEEVDACNGGLG
jgi:hypothetical protein